MAKWEPDRYVDEVYDEYCRKCNCMTEHSMGICLPCEWQKPAQVKNKFDKKRQDSEGEGQ